MFEEAIAEQNLHWQGVLPEPLIERQAFHQICDYLTTPHVIALTGARRAGKSTLLYRLIVYLICEQGVEAKQILYLNLEHPLFSPYVEENTFFSTLMDTYRSMVQPKGKFYLLIDEIQFAAYWALFVKAEYEMRRSKIVVTGSTSSLLAAEWATTLSGRILPVEVWPLGFDEVAQHHQIDPTDPLVIHEKPPRLRPILTDYLHRGGFPDPFLHPNQAIDLLSSRAKSVLYQDVATRLHSRKPLEIERLFVYLMSHLGGKFTYHRLSQLFDLSDKAVKEYWNALVEAYLVVPVPRFSYSLKKQFQAPNKGYAIDPGQANAIAFQFRRNQGRYLENAVLLSLKQAGAEVFYYQTPSDKEVDFVAQYRQQLALVQVCWDASDPETRHREKRALVEAAQALDLKCAFLITESEEGQIFEQGITLEILCAYRYLALPPPLRREVLWGKSNRL